MKHKIKLFFALNLCLYLFYFIFFNGTVYAAGPGVKDAHSVMPFPADFTQGGGVNLLVAGYSPASGYLLDADESIVRIYTPHQSGKIYIRGGGQCGGTGDRGNVQTDFKLYRMYAAWQPGDLSPSSNDGYYHFSSTGYPGLRGKPPSSTPYAVVDPSDAGSKALPFHSDSEPGACTPGGIEYSYTATADNQVPAGATGNLAPYAGYYGLEFHAERTSGVGWNMFTLDTNHGDDKISYYSGSGDKFAIKDDTGGVPGSPGDFTMGFAPACTLSKKSTNQVTLRWFDVDAGQANQNYQSPVHAYIYEYTSDGVLTDRDGGSWNNGRFDINLTSGNHQSDSRDITVRGQHKYVLKMDNIYSANGIQFQLPFDSFNTGISCPNPPEIKDWTLEGDTQLTSPTAQPGDSVNFANRIKNAGGDPANYTWSVERNYNDKNGINTGWTHPSTLASGNCTNVKEDGTCPDYVDAFYTFTFPAVAKDGATYCQRIKFDHKDGPGDSSSSYSEDKCVTYKIGGSRPIVAVTTSCSGIHATVHDDDFNNAKSSYSYILTIWSGNNNAAPPFTNPDNNNGYVVQKGGTTDVSGEIFENYPVPSSNNGWTYSVYVQNIDPGGNKSGVFLDGTINTSGWTDQCYSATCTARIEAKPGSEVPGRPDGVKAGGDYDLVISITNTSRDSNTLPTNLGAYYLGASTNVENRLNDSIGPGQTKDVRIPEKAPNTTGPFVTPTAYPDYNGLFPIGMPCGTANPGTGYNHFDLKPDISFADVDTQDPVDIKYDSSVKVIEQGNPNGITATTTRQLFKNGVEIDNPGNNTQPFLNVDYDQRDYKNSNYVAGDKYCLKMNISPGEGFTALVSDNGTPLDPSDDVYDVVPVADHQSPKPPRETCFRVNNKPYFKVYGGAVRAGGDFYATNQACIGGGQLGGWYNNEIRNYQFGSSNQLSALAMVESFGVGTRRTSADRDENADALSLANTSNGLSFTTDKYNPLIGGNFAGGECLTDGDPGTGATTSFGSQPIEGHVVGDNEAVFINGGDAYISGDIEYEDLADWTQKPSYVLRVSGNIYIDNNVTNLDGMYIAGGNIYTCGNSDFTPMPAKDMYANCSNQLTVHGTLSARNVNFMRTYGSLRDEKPEVIAGSPFVPGVPGVRPRGQSQDVFRFYCGGNQQPGALGYHKYKLGSSTPDAGCTLDGPAFFLLPGPTNGSSPLYAVTSADDKTQLLTKSNAEAVGATLNAQSAYFGGSVSILGYSDPTAVNNPRVTPLYRLYSTVDNTHLALTDYAQRLDLVDNSGGRIIYEGESANVYWLFGADGIPGVPGSPAQPAVPVVVRAPSVLSCSHTPGGGVGSADPLAQRTCASEVIINTPELQIANPKITNGGGKNKVPYDTITSLPPVL